MKKTAIQALVALTLANSAYAGPSTYTMPLLIDRITFGSTGNMYLYPYEKLRIRERVNHGGGDVTTFTEYTQTIVNPAGCSAPSRVVLKADHPLYEILVNRTQAGAGGGKYYGGSGGGAQYYISGSSCEANSPKILRIQESSQGATQAPRCNRDLEYQYQTDASNTTSYSCYINAIK